MEQAADNKRGKRAMERTSGNRRQQINNQPLMVVTKAGKDTAVMAKAAPLVNGAFRCRMDHGNSRKVGGNGRAVVDNKQQWQRHWQQSTKSDGGKQWR